MKKLVFVALLFGGALYGQTGPFVGISPITGDSLFAKCFCLESVKFPAPDTTWKAPKVVPIRYSPENQRVIIPLPARKD